MLTFNDLLDDMASSMEQPRAELVQLLIDRLRPSSSRDIEDIHYRLRRLIDTLSSSPTRAQVLHDYVFALIANFHQVSLYSDSGILGNEGFFSAMRQRLGWRVLPPVRQSNQLRDLFEVAFHKKSDPRWIANINEQDWNDLFQILGRVKGRQDLRYEARSRVLSAMMIISYRITAIGLEPELIRAYPAINEFKSPFLVQNREIIEYIDIYKRRARLLLDPDTDADARDNAPQPDEKPAQVMLDQCRDIMNRVKRSTRKQGVSISLTNLLIRLDQSLTRIDLLLDLLNDDAERSRKSLAQMLRLVTQSQVEQSSVRALVAINTELLARQVTENASRVGEHYVSTDRKGYWQMYRSAAGAGLIIAIMAALKVLAGRLVLAPFSRAFLYSMNYGLGFMFIHIIHCTVATKQPAMTAASLAATVQQSSGSRQAQLAELAELTVDIMRTQFIAILGNISIAMPSAVLIAWLWQRYLDQPILTQYKALEMLHEINPFTSLALFYAAIAGVWLFVAGLIAGYYDNLAVYHQIGPRLRQHPTLQRWLGKARLDKTSVYIENNLGALAGNFWFGIFLGSTGTVGYILGLPLDIRHIAFSSANFAQAVFSLNTLPDISLVLMSFLGVLMIGMTNLMVSFGLALFVALRARRVQYAQWRPLMHLLMTHFITRPSDFFWPAKPAEVVPEPVDTQASQANDRKRDNS
jgi:site-specific recombinase